MMMPPPPAPDARAAIGPGRSISPRTAKRHREFPPEGPRPPARAWAAAVRADAAEARGLVAGPRTDSVSAVALAELPATLRERAARFYADPAARAAFLAARPCTALWPHQEAGVAFLAAREAAGAGGLFCDGMRLGKTLTLLAFLLRDTQRRVRAGEPRFGQPTLIAVPHALLGTLRDEMVRHLGADLAGLLVAELSEQGDAPHALLAGADLVLTSYPALAAVHARRLAAAAAVPGRGALLYGVRWRRVVCDEAHAFVNDATALFAAVDALRATYRWFVSATPMQNAARDLLAALRFVLPPAEGAALPPPDSPAMAALLARVMLRRERRPTTTTTTTLPPPEPGTLVLAWASAAEARLYAGVRAAAAARVARTRTRTRTQTDRPGSAPFWVLRLRQASTCPDLVPRDIRCASGCRAFDAARDSRRAWDAAMRAALLGGEEGHGVDDVLPPDVLPPASTKERAVLDYVRTVVEARGEQCVVFSSFVGVLERLAALLAMRAEARGEPPRHVLVHGGTTDRDACLARCRADRRLSVLLLSVKIGGTGHDLSFANHAVLVDPWWNPFTEDQAFARLGGPNQRRAVSLHRLAVADTIDAHVIALAERKRAVAALLATPALDDAQTLLRAACFE